MAVDVVVQPELLSPHSFRQLFDPPMGRRQLYEAVQSGRIRCVRFGDAKAGQRIYIPRSEVVRLVQGQEPNPAVPVTAEERVNGAR
jgi:hypothetical protein